MSESEQSAQRFIDKYGDFLKKIPGVKRVLIERDGRGFISIWICVTSEYEEQLRGIIRDDYQGVSIHVSIPGMGALDPKKSTPPKDKKDE